VSASASASGELVASGGVPDVPVPFQWREVAPHEVRWSVWTPKDALVSGVEAGVVVQGSDSLTPAACVPDAVSSTSSRQFWSCSLIARQGPQTARVRAVNESGASVWAEIQVTFNRGSCTDAVAAAGACEEFDTGPGGGFVFYDAGSRQSWGQYLEAAPPGWSGSTDDPGAPWCSSDQPGYGSKLATGMDIGSGASNTQLIIQNCGTDSAAGQAAAYRGGGKTDWFLPSKDELGKIYDRRSEIGGLTSGDLWSSSQSTEDEREAWYYDFDYTARAHVKVNFKQLSGGGVRPVRAF
jgi:hypothetical protein